MVHRRPVSAALAFAAVLLGIAAIVGAPQAAQVDGAIDSSAESASATVEGKLEVPVRLADPAVAGVVSPGDVVDVILAGPRSGATVVAAEVVVTALPTTGDGGPWSSDEGLVMVAASDAEALALAGASVRGPLTIVLHG